MNDYKEVLSKYDLLIPFTDEAAINFSNEIMNLDDFSFYCAWHTLGTRDLNNAIKVHRLISSKLYKVLQDDEIVDRIRNKYKNG